MDIKVLAGTPSAEELAALCVVITAKSRSTGMTPAPPTSAWRDPGRRLGVDRTWRDSSLPR